MKKQPNSQIGGGFEVRSGSDSETLRTTILIPSTLDKNLEVCRLKLGLSKNEVIRKALSQFVREHDLDPERTPNLLISYKT